MVLERNIFSNISSIMVVSKFGNLILQQSLFKDTFWHVLKMLALSSINVKILQWSTKNYAAKIKCRKHITIWLPYLARSIMGVWARLQQISKFFLPCQDKDKSAPPSHTHTRTFINDATPLLTKATYGNQREKITQIWTEE